MSNYDDDDYILDDHADGDDWFDLDSEDMDIYDFDDRFDTYLAGVEADIEEVRYKIAKSLMEDEDDAILERLEDELALLMMDYTRFGR